MSADTKTCQNCYHRSGERCNRTGYHWTTELQFGGRCAGQKNGPPKMNLWEPLIPVPKRQNIWKRITQYFKGAKHDK